MYAAVRRVPGTGRRASYRVSILVLAERVGNNANPVIAIEYRNTLVVVARVPLRSPPFILCFVHGVCANVANRAIWPASLTPRGRGPGRRPHAVAS